MKSIRHLELSKDLSGHATKFTDHTGSEFNGCKVKEFCGWEWDVTKRRKYWFKVECFCGEYFYTCHTRILYQPQRSCGCLPKEACNKTHQRSGDRIYRNYHGMLSRCQNKNHGMYPLYGGRGIKVCDRWANKEDGFTNFLEDMGEIPEDLSLDRIDVNGNYEPSNCRWATRTEQNYNQRIRKDNTSGITGVRSEPRYNTWVASIRLNSKNIYLGSYKTLYEAYLARIEGELKYYGVVKQPIFDTEQEFNLYLIGINETEGHNEEVQYDDH